MHCSIYLRHNNETFATGSSDRVFGVFTVFNFNMERIAVLKKHEQEVICVSYYPSGDFLASVSFKD